VFSFLFIVTVFLFIYFWMRAHLGWTSALFFLSFAGLCLIILSLAPRPEHLSTDATTVAIRKDTSSGRRGINNNFNFRQFKFNPNRNMYVRRREENTRAYLDFYYKEPMVAFNRYIEGKNDPSKQIAPYLGPVPSLQDVKSRLPSPFWEGHKEAIDCYWSTWQIVRETPTSSTL
jgi:hypothetical protein